MRIKQLVVASACSLNTVAFAADRYVTPGGPGTDGAISWATAFPTLHDALVSDFTQPGDILYLGQGTYSPNGTDTSATFLVTDAGLTIKGGYLGGIGNPGTPGVRDINAYPTILTGLLPNEIRCKHVITVNDVGIADPTGAQILIEGVTIRDGQAGQPPPVEGTPDESVRGGGATVLESSVAFVKCKFLNNAALWDGGGLHVYDRPDQGGPDPWIMRSDVVNCLFEDCLATHGGGMANAEG